MGWLGYLLGRAYFSRRILWIVVAVLVVFFFGTLLGGLLPSVGSDISWQAHVAGFAAGVFAAWLMHPRPIAAPASRPRQRRHRARVDGRAATPILSDVSDRPADAADRHVRLRGRRPDRRPGRPRPAAARGAALRRRHRPRALRPEADRRRPPLRPRGDGRAGRHRGQGARHRLQQRQRRLPARCPRALRRAGDRGRAAGRAPGGRGRPATQGRRHRHGGHGDQRRLRGRVRGRARASRSTAPPARSSPSSSSGA